MADGYRGAKLERAIASRLISRLEDGRLLIPTDAPWVNDYVREITEWSGSAEEVCDQIDVSSYASYEAGKDRARQWSGCTATGFAK
jgi:phage terminase large subunit-like protein